MLPLPGASSTGFGLRRPGLHAFHSVAPITQRDERERLADVRVIALVDALERVRAAAVEELPEAGSGPGGQGFGPRATESPPHFACDELEAAIAFFEEMGYVCFKEALTEAQLAHINDFCDRTQETDPKAWGIKRDREGYHVNQGLIYSQPWLDNPELDQYAVNHRSFKTIVEASMGSDIDMTL